MKISLNIDNQEIGQEIKSLVQAHLKTMTRDAVQEHLRDEINRKLKLIEETIDEKEIKKMAQSQVESSIKNIINPRWNKTPVSEEINRLIEEEVKKSVTKYQSDIEEMVSRKIKEKLQGIL